MVENAAYNLHLESQNASEFSKIPSAPRLAPMEVPLSVYMEMDVFYLEESDS